MLISKLLRSQPCQTPLPTSPCLLGPDTIASGCSGEFTAYKVKFLAHLQEAILGTSLVTQWLRLCAPNAGGPGSIPGQVTRSCMHAATKSSHVTTKEAACLN